MNSIWINKAGEQINMSDMSDTHLANAEAFLMRRIEKQILANYTLLAFDVDFDPGDVCSSSERMLDTLAELRQEIERRTTGE